MACFLGIDPGMSGAWAIITGRKIISVCRAKDKTGAEIKDWLRVQVIANPDMTAAIEQVHSMPKQGVASSFKFGMSYTHADADSLLIALWLSRQVH